MTRARIGQIAYRSSSMLCAITVTCAFTSGCARTISSVARALPPLGSASLSVGEWSGTTSQGMPIEFSVSPDETVTTISIGYDFNGCTGSHTFSDLAVPTNPGVTCIPGPCPDTAESYRAFSYMDGSFAGGPVIQINGVFLPRNEARGQVNLINYPVCGTATAVEWIARR